MKRSLLVAMVAGLLIAGSAWAEPYTMPLPSVGVRGGINIAHETLSPRTGVDLRSRTFGAAGLTYEFSLYQPVTRPTTGWSLRSELMYDRTGGRFVSGGLAEDDRVDQLRLAPFVVYHAAMGNFVPYIEGGPWAGIDLSHKYTVSGNADGLNISQSGNIPNWRTGDFGLNAGLGFKIPTPAGALSLDGRYSWGLINKYNGSTSGTGNTIGEGSGLKRHSDGILIMAGYDFQLPFMK
jgi:hypothetical protein